MDQILAWLNGGSAAPAAAPSRAASKAASVSASSSAALPEFAAKREVFTIQINMDNLLGARATEDQYIRALLMVDGVTSVTLDRVRGEGEGGRAIGLCGCLVQFMRIAPNHISISHAPHFHVRRSGSWRWCTLRSRTSRSSYTGRCR